jgi:hypothetical protein
MALKNEADLQCKTKRLTALSLVVLLIVTSLLGISLNTAAQPDNVFVDGIIRDNKTLLPISGATILLQNRDDGTINSTTTDGAGYFNIGIYTPGFGGNFALTAFHDDYLVNVTNMMLMPWNNQTQDMLLDPATEKGSVVHGTIKDAVTGAPIPFAGIAALSGTYINISGADATGYYLMVLESNLTYTFQVGPSGYESQYKSLDFGWGDNLTLDFLMEPTNCTLSGYVKDAMSPLGSASVLVYRLGDPFPMEYRPMVNATTGYYETNLTRGVWQVEIWESGYYAQTLTVIMENGKTTWQNITLRSTPASMATVQGYIRYYNNGSGVPFEAASADNMNGTWNTYNFTDALGWYSLPVIPGDITISAWASGYDSESTEISVMGGQTYWVNHTVSEPFENSFIDGYVKVNGTGKPGVQVMAAYSWRMYQTMTDPSGYYNLSVPAAPMEVQAIKDGYLTAFHEVDTTASQTTELNMTITNLEWSTEIRGYITNETGGAVENAYVAFDFDGWGDESVTTVPDYTGLYQRMAPSGNATYFIVPNDHEYKQGEVTFPPDQLYWFSETLTTVKEKARIICRFTDIYTGKPLKHMGLSIRELDLDWWKDVETDDKGNVKTGVPSGFVYINFDASSNGYQNPGTYQDPSTMQFLIKPGETRWLNISLFPREFASVIHGIVNDTLDNPIPGATVYVRHGDTIATNITDGTGYYEVSLPGDHPIEIWARTPTKKVAYDWIWALSGTDNWYDLVLENSNAWIEGIPTDEAVDIDGDLLYDVLYVNVTVNTSIPAEFMLRGELREGRNTRGRVTGAEALTATVTGPQTVTLAFTGELIRGSEMSGYYVDMQLMTTNTYEVLDIMDHFTKFHKYDEFDTPNAAIVKPVGQWLVDSDYDGLYNYLVFNVTLNVSVAGDYGVMGAFGDIWGTEFANEFELFTLDVGVHDIQLSFDGTTIYNHGETIGSLFLIVFPGMPVQGGAYMDALSFYTPYSHEIFQRYDIDAYVSGFVTDKNDQPIQGMEVMIYNITSRFLNTTMTDGAGYYEFGGWEGDWVLVAEDDEDSNMYSGRLSEIQMTTGGNLSHDERFMEDIKLDDIEQLLVFSDWNSTRLDWLLNVIGDNETIRFMFDVLQFGDGDGFVSEEEADMIMSFIPGMNLPPESSDSFMVDGIWYDLDPLSETLDAGLVGSITSDDPVYIHMTGNYTANITIPSPSPHEFTLNCSYDDTSPETVTDNNATYIYYIATPSGWGRTANGTTQNVTISGTDFITVDPQGDPDKMDADITEWINMTISLGNAPTYGVIKGYVTLQGSGSHTGVIVTVYDNATQKELASAPTDPSGFYEIVGLAPGTYDVVAHKEGYIDNWSYNHVIIAGGLLRLDFTLYSFPPTISHTPVTTAFIGHGINIYADIKDDGKVAEAILYYKEIGQMAFSSVNMSRIASTSTYSGTIPAQSQYGYVFYYIYAEDSKGNSVTHPLTGDHVIFIYEIDPPEISNIIAAPDPAEYPQNVNVSAQVTDDHDIIIVKLFIEMPDLSTTNTTMEYDPISGRFFINASYTQLGTYSYTIWANDTFDNWNSSSGTFQVLDTIAPSSGLDILTQYWYFTSPVTLNATATDSGTGVADVELYYRFSTDNATWGIWTPFGTDTTAPYGWPFTFPAGEGYYEFFSIATDVAGNPETMKVAAETLCGYDASAPVSFVENIPTYWCVAPSIIVTVNVSETVGIDIVHLWYRYSTDNSTWGNWTWFGSLSSGPFDFTFDFPSGEGYYEYFSLANDTAGNSEAAKAAGEAMCGYDFTDPTTSVDTISPYWHTSTPLLISATASDPVSGISDVTLWYRFSSDNLAWDPWMPYGTVNIAPYQWNFNFASQGYYQFFSIGNDTAGHAEPSKVASEALCGYDITPPTSSVDPIAPYWQSQGQITITASASDDLSGEANVELFYRYSDDDTTWGGWSSHGTDSSFPWSFSFAFTNDGYYQFYSTSADIMGNTEAAKTSEEAQCAYDSSPPSVSGFSVLPDPAELGDTINISARLSDIAGIDGAWVEITLDGTLVGNFSMESADEYYWYLHSADEPGSLDVEMWFADNSGLWDSSSDSVTIEDTADPVLSGLDMDPASPDVESTVRIELTVTDASSDISVEINITAPDGTWIITDSMNREGQTDTFYYQYDFDLLGEHDILITAVDGSGNQDEITDMLTTQDPQAPQADAGPPQQVTVGTSVTLDGGLSSDNYGIANYTWSFTDNGLKKLYGVITDYTFNTVRNNNITLTIRDFSGNTDTDITWVNITAVSGTGTVTGTVLDENGDPIAGATVYIDGHTDLESTTDSWGRYTLNDVPEGTQSVIVIKDGYKRDSGDVNVQEGQSNTADNIVMAKSTSEEPTSWALYGIIAAIVAIVVVILLFLLMGKGKEKEEIPAAAAKETVIDEIFFMTNDGRLIKHFTRRLRPDMDEDILSGMLVAVQDFIKDSFRDRQASLDEMRFGKFEILLGRGKHIILATIILGEEMESIKPQVAKCVEDIESEFGEVLEDWDGNLASVIDSSKYINDLIDGKYAEGS